MNQFKSQVRVNHRIRATEVRLIGDHGSQLGVLPISQALKLATEQGLDLVEVAPEAKPPVCRIVDYGKFRYEQAKKHKGDVRHSHAGKVKELKFHVNIGAHDYMIKLRHATEFLEKGMRVKMSLYFRGREMQHQELGVQLMNRVVQELAPHGHTDVMPRLIGKNLHVILVPGKAKPKFTTTGGAPAAGATTASISSSSAETPRPFGTNIKIDLKPASEQKS